MSEPPFSPDLVLNITRVVSIPVETLYLCWTTPELLMRWFTPAPWRTTACEMDLRNGGKFFTFMEGPSGEKFPHEGVFLEVIPNQKLVFTDAFTTGWVPSAKAYMVAHIHFEALGNQSRYMAKAYHWSKADCDEHRARGFESGWNKALDQLIEVAESLS